MICPGGVNGRPYTARHSDAVDAERCFSASSRDSFDDPVTYRGRYIRILRIGVRSKSPRLFDDR